MSAQLEKKQPYQTPKKILSKEMPKDNYTLPTIKNEEPQYNNPEKNISVEQSPKQK